MNTPKQDNKCTVIHGKQQQSSHISYQYVNIDIPLSFLLRNILSGNGGTTPCPWCCHVTRALDLRCSGELALCLCHVGYAKLLKMSPAVTHTRTY